MSASDSPQGGSSGPSLPGWLPTSLEGFRNLVLGTVATWIVTGILSTGAAVVDSVLAIYEALALSVGILFDQVATGGSVLLTGPTIVLDVLDTTITTIAANAGPLSPLVIVALWGGTLAVGLWIARQLPGWLWRLYQVIPGT